MSSYPLDRISYEIGMINCFIEMVACGVKPLAISPPIEPENLPVLEEVSRELSEGFGTKYYVDLEMMIISRVRTSPGGSTPSSTTRTTRSFAATKS